MAFSGFADQTPVSVKRGLFGMMATKTGLARRLAYLVIHRVARVTAAVAKLFCRRSC
jgi:hypothetical protein